MESYRAIWNNLFNYLKEHWNIKDCEKISSEHIAAYMDYKIEYYPSKQYLEKISAALGKLEIALKHFAKHIRNEMREYDFSIRQALLDEAASREFSVAVVNSGPRYEKTGWPFWDRRLGRAVGKAVNLYGPGLDAPVWVKELDLKGPSAEK